MSNRRCRNRLTDSDKKESTPQATLPNPGCFVEALIEEQHVSLFKSCQTTRLRHPTKPMGKSPSEGKGKMERQTSN